MKLFEAVGFFFFKHCRFWLFYLFMSAPFLLACSLLVPRFLILRDLEQAFDTTALRSQAALEKRIQKKRFLERYMNAEPYFINKKLETLPLLSKELEDLHKLKAHPAYIDKEAAMRRIAFLEEKGNRLAFAEENMRSSARVKETEERLLHPVEVDSDDLAHLLCLIENCPVNTYSPDTHSPQLLIQDFLLSKKTTNIYELNLTLLKREFTPSP